jgi:hypothetical protein
MLRKFGIIAVLSLMALALAAVPALAVTNFDNAPGGAHYRQGSVEPVCTINPDDNSVSCTGTTIGGVGNTNADLALITTVDADLTCTNRGGSVVEPHSGTFTDSVEATLVPNRNGQIVVNSVATDPITEEDVLAGFECPNRNWTADVVDLTTSFTYTLTFVGFDEPAISISGTEPTT